MVGKTMMLTPPASEVRLHKEHQRAATPLSLPTAVFPLIFIPQQAYEPLQSAPEGKLFIIQIEEERKAKSHQR